MHIFGEIGRHAILMKTPICTLLFRIEFPLGFDTKYAIITLRNTRLSEGLGVKIDSNLRQSFPFLPQTKRDFYLNETKFYSEDVVHELMLLKWRYSEIAYRLYSTSKQLSIRWSKILYSTEAQLCHWYLSRIKIITITASLIVVITY